MAKSFTPPLGPTAMAFGYDDPVAPAKVLSAFAKKNKILEIKGGLLEGGAIDQAAIKSLAQLPSREVLLGKLAGILQAPVSGLVSRHCPTLTPRFDSWRNIPSIKATRTPVCCSASEAYSSAVAKGIPSADIEQVDRVGLVADGLAVELKVIKEKKPDTEIDIKAQNENFEQVAVAVGAVVSVIVNEVELNGVEVTVTFASAVRLVTLAPSVTLYAAEEFIVKFIVKFVSPMIVIFVTAIVIEDPVIESL